MKIKNFNIQLIYVVKDQLEPEWSWISDNNGWTGFHLWYLFQNSVKIQTGQKEYLLSQGDTFLFDLSQNHHCTHDPKKPAGMFTAYFHCDQSQILQQMLREGSLQQQNHPPLFTTNMDLFEESIRGTNTTAEMEMWLAPVFHQLLSPESGNLLRRGKIEKICREMDTHPQKSYRLEELADRTGYSKNQFIRVFRQVTGVTPYAYLVNSRIAKAKHLLLFSDYTATQIAQMLGYHDLNHFSAQFYGKTGCYPSRYAEKLREKP